MMVVASRPGSGVTLGGLHYADCLVQHGRALCPTEASGLMAAAIPPPEAGNQANKAPAPPLISTTPVSWLPGALVGLLLAAYLAMAELDRLTADVLDKDGQSWSLTTLMGPSRLFDLSTDGWTATGFTTDGGRLFGWMLTYLLVDVIFIAAYGWLLACWLGWTLPVKLLVGLDLAEDLAVVLYGRPTAHSGLACVPIVFSLLKWVAVIVVLLVLLRRLTDPTDAYSWRSALIRLRRALYVHRFSLVPLIPLAALGLISGPNILDQLPDIQRQWSDTGVGHWQAAAATVVLVLLGIGLFVLGRMRSEFARQRATETPGEAATRPNPNLWIYVVGPALVLAGVLLNRGSGVVWSRAAIFCLVPLLVVGASLLLRKAVPNLARPGLKALDPADVPTITLVGDVLAILPLVIGGLALVRSYTAVVALDGLRGVGNASLGGDWWARGALAVGFAGASLGWLMGVGLLNWVASQPWLKPRLTVGNTTMFSQGLRWGAMIWWLAVFLLLYLAPLFLASLGAIACVLLALAALALMLGSFAVIAQDGGAPEVLWKLGFRAAPLTLLLIAAIVLAGKAGDDTQVHATRNLPAAASMKRDSLPEAFDAWKMEPGCQLPTGQVTLRPMFLVAAEGGGIRAAYWTAAALDRLVKANPCVGSSTLFSGGASGGAVGLTVARFAEPGTSAAQVEKMADPRALAAGSLGLFVRDLAYAATGVPAPALGSASVASRLQATGNGHWADRAALIEAVWQTQAPGLDVPFVGGPKAALSPTGELVLTSTSVGTGCRYLVSQVTLHDSPAGTDCATLRQPVAGSVDLLSAYAAKDKDRDLDNQHCVGPLLAATAAMFASRFPFVTPSGVVGPCGAITEPDQLVDGGYVENSGLGTIVDLADQWLPLVRQHNTEQLRTATSPTLFVPVVLYMDNGTGSDLRPPSLKVTDEILVPSTANKRAQMQQSDTPTLLQRAATLVAANNLWDPSICTSGATPNEEPAACARVKRAGEQIDTWRPRPVVVVHQSTFPAVTAPLGWTLSEDSMATMNEALAQQAAVKCRPETKDLLCTRQLGSLADALALLPARADRRP
jgi:hypothetical protein